MASWLPLLNYSTKYNISLSTLRRRIKARSIEYKLDQGKYFILDQSSQAASQSGSPIANVQTPLIEIPRRREVQTAPPMMAPPPAEMPEPTQSNFVEASVLTSANRLVEELKAAYAKILQEKEEQISQLKDEIVDLRMLVRILEDTSKKAVGAVATREAEEDSPAESEPVAVDDDYLFTDFQNRQV